MKSTIRMAVAVLAASAVAAPALAQGFGGGGMQMTPEQREAAFVAADKNGDGKLDTEEFKASLPEQIRGQIDDGRLAQIFQARDANSDGFIDKAEYSAPMRRPGQ